MFVTTPMIGVSRRKEPSLSSASATRRLAAAEPRVARRGRRRRPPMTTVGSRPAFWQDRGRRGRCRGLAVAPGDGDAVPSSASARRASPPGGSPVSAPPARQRLRGCRGAPPRSRRGRRPPSWPPTRGRSGSRIPRARRRATVADSARSDPVTRKPRDERISAMPHIPDAADADEVHPAGTAEDPRRASLPRPLRELQQDPDRPAAGQQRGPAVGDEGERQTLGRERARHDHRLTMAWIASSAVTPNAMRGAERIGDPEPDPDAAPQEDAEEDDRRQRADESKLLAQDGEDEVGVGLRKVEELLLRLPAGRAPARPPSAKARGLDDLVPGAARVRPGVEERERPAEPVRGHVRCRATRGPRDRRSARRCARRAPATKIMQSTTPTDRHRRAEVGLEQDQPGHAARHEHVRAGCPVCHGSSRSRRGAATRTARNDQDQLGELGRLDRPAPDPPARPLRATGRRAAPGPAGRRGRTARSGLRSGRHVR